MNETQPLALRTLHERFGARFTAVSGAEVVADYGDVLAEHRALRETVGVLDLSFRSRLCLLGSDRARFLHGQITNDVKRLRPGEGCYAALATAKGKMQSDLNVFCLPEELLLDFEPGLTQTVTQRLEKYIVADDVQVMDVAVHYGLLSVQGPDAETVVRGLGLFAVQPSGGPGGRNESGRANAELPTKPFAFSKISDATLGEIYLMNSPRLQSLNVETAYAGEAYGLRGQAQRDPALAGGLEIACETKAPSSLRSAGAVQNGFDLFVPAAALAAVADELIAAAKSIGGGPCGWTAFETARIEAGIPRFGADMDEANLPLECGIEARAISYNKGCYIGQEVINRIHSIGHVNRELCGLRLADDLKTLPARGDKLFKDGKEVGHITSAVFSPRLKSNIALGYVRREVNQVSQEMILHAAGGQSRAKLVALPFVG